MALPDISSLSTIASIGGGPIGGGWTAHFWHEAMMYGRIFTTQQKNQHFAMLLKPPGLV